MKAQKQAKDERADLAAWRRRHALRSSNAAVPVRSQKRYRRKAKHPARGW